MNVTTYHGRVFTPFEILYWGGFLGVPTLLSIGAILTKQDPKLPVVAWVILAAAVLGMYAVAAGFLYRRWTWQKNLRFLLSPPGLVIGWAEDVYCVSGEAVELVVNDCILRMQPEFPDAAKALNGCVVWFREETWMQDVPLGVVSRKVAGVQDGQLLIVGWREDLKTSALMHELAHRVLQVYGGDPPEVLAHHTMSRLGVL